MSTFIPVDIICCVIVSLLSGVLQAQDAASVKRLAEEPLQLGRDGDTHGTRQGINIDVGARSSDCGARETRD
jgi:hypothetical protein